MYIKDLYSIIVTDKRIECRDFYVRWFGFQVVFEASWFVYLVTHGERPFGIAFMADRVLAMLAPAAEHGRWIAAGCGTNPASEVHEE